MLVGVRQQSQETGAFDGAGQLALVAGFGAGDARRDNFAVFGDKVFQQVYRLVIHLFDAFGSEAAEFSAFE